MDLSGQWNFELDPHDQGLEANWFTRKLAQTIQLPGSLQSQGYGDEISVDTPWTGSIVDQSWFTEERYAPYRQPGSLKVPFWLQPKRYYKGAAWYQREVTIPDEWKGQRIILRLERPHWETRLWLDESAIGSKLSLSTPHVYDLGVNITPGKHLLTLRVDNRMLINVGPNAHSMTDHTQGNWNGIVGKIELQAVSPVWITDVQVYPDLERRLARLFVEIDNALLVAGSAKLDIRASGSEHPGSIPALQADLTLNPDRTRFEIEFELGPEVRLWDEFSPALYNLDFILTMQVNGQAFQDRRQTRFGMREISTLGTQIAINGRKTFLRGTLESCIFPLTGYPPTDLASWKRIIQICKDHGLNHIRFHSWCPPEAAFQAADEVGFYYQVECASWANQGASIGEGDALDTWLYDEAGRIIAAYGNHPSFVLMAYGNEPAGEFVDYLAKWVNYWKVADPRRLHTGGAGWPSIPENQYQNTPMPRIHAWGAGLSSRINALPPETVTDYREDVAMFEAPIVSHEIGQWCVYPNFAEIEKYSGFMQPKNFEIFRDSLAANHMGDQAQDFWMASGKLQALCYKEEIESALRTLGFGGFQLLDLHDFPGQGTALVGVLDPFWDSKGYISPAEYRRFCNSTVLLARLKQRIWNTAENFKAEIEVAHFGPEALADQVIKWRVLSTDGRCVIQGVFQPQEVSIGNAQPLGIVEFPLRDFQPAQKYRLVVSIDGTPFENDWDFWVFAAHLELPNPDDILVMSELDEAAKAYLIQGGKVLFLPPAQNVKVTSVIGFSSIFWNTAWTGNQEPHTLGILCDPQHPVFASFPTEYHSNWQWWELISGAAAVTMDVFPPELRPLVQPIDTWFENRRLGLLFEAAVGAGKLMVCSMDLETDLEQRRVARQMRLSVIRYMQSAAFDPAVSLEVNKLQELISRP
jgi:beta-galactosidase/beta-glucuronidase